MKGPPAQANTCPAGLKFANNHLDDPEKPWEQVMTHEVR